MSTTETHRIPIDNIYYLFCYAWNYFPSSRFGRVGSETGPTVPCLLAKLLVAALRDARRRGLASGYTVIEEQTPRIRGRILIARSVVSNTLSRSSAICAVDELTQDIPLNQAVKATLRRLLSASELDTETRSEVREGIGYLRRITDRPLSRALLHRIQLQPGNRIYCVLLTICQFLYDCVIARQGHGKYSFRDVVDDQPLMARVFQQFVKTFYALEQSLFRVSSRRLTWLACAEKETDLAYLPSMLTDVSMQSQDRSIIIECKYYSATFQKQFTKSSVHSEHLYQLFAYLRNSGDQTEGVLLYPCVGEPLHITLRIHGHLIKVRTLDLTQKWTGIKNDLLTLLN